MQRLQAGSITVADIERIARIDAEEVVLAAAKANVKSNVPHVRIE